MVHYRLVIYLGSSDSSNFVNHNSLFSPAAVPPAKTKKEKKEFLHHKRDLPSPRPICMAHSSCRSFLASYQLPPPRARVQAENTVLTLGARIVHRGTCIGVLRGLCFRSRSRLAGRGPLDAAAGSGGGLSWLLLRGSPNFVDNHTPVAPPSFLASAGYRRFCYFHSTACPCCSWARDQSDGQKNRTKKGDRIQGSAPVHGASWDREHLEHISSYYFGSIWLLHIKL